MRFQTTILTLMIPGLLSAVHGKDSDTYKQWGTETLSMIKRDYWMPGDGLYSEFAADDKANHRHPSFMWGVGVQLSALAAASAVEPEKYLEETRAYAESIRKYWGEHKGIGGFDVQPNQKEADRYYDDNAWLVLALSEVFEVTRDKKHLDQAIATFAFVMSGEDEKLGGGLYWRENSLTTKNNCTNAPAIASALRLHQLTREDKYLETAKRLHAWTNKHLQDTDGLYWDHIELGGRVDKRKFSYNSALMIRSNCLLAEITGDASHLEEAKRIAAAAEKQWIRENGSIGDSGRFAHLLLESFLAVHRQDKNPRWIGLMDKALEFVQDELKEPNGRYPHHWDRKFRGGPKETELLNQASPARAFWVAAEAHGKS